MQETALSIIKALHEAGYEAYLAGGCVRDMLLNLQPKDHDIVTSARPNEIAKIFPKTKAIGEAFGVMLVIQSGIPFEVATFRCEGPYTDGRRPESVEFCSAEEDAKRRDFTINALFYDPINNLVIDYIGGQQDLKENLLRFIGDPVERIKEDHLRIIRAVRFKNVYQLQYHPETYRALKKHAKLCKYTSRERLRDELNKIIISPHAADAFEEMSELGILAEILPELENMRGVAQPKQYHHEGDVWEHTKRALKALPDDAGLELRWATLLHDVGKPDTFKLMERIRFDGHCEYSRKHARAILTRLRFPKRFIDRICFLVSHHMMMVPLTEMSVGRRRHWFLRPEFKTLLALFKADAQGTVPTDLSLYQRINDLYESDMLEISSEPPKLLAGEDIMRELQMPPGSKVGKILSELRELQLEKSINTKEEALAWLKKNHGLNKV